MEVLRKYGIWAAIIVVALLVSVAGAMKLAGTPALHESFAILGLPGWFGYFIGLCEVAGAIGLLIRPLSALAAAGLSIIMLGAIYFHVVHTPIGQTVPALVILLLCVFIFTRRREAMLKFGGA